MSKSAVPLNKADSLDRSENLFDKVKRFLLGDDIFISYSRADAINYAPGLANQLAKLKFSCFLDQWGTPPGKELPKPLRRALDRSTVLVLIGTNGAARSQPVMEEVKKFLKTRRPILPISFDGSLESASWFDSIEGLARTPESTEALVTGNPSEAVIARIEKSFKFTRRNLRMRRIFLGTLLAISALIAGGTAWGSSIVAQARDAEQNRKTAVEQARQADELKLTAEHDRVKAETAREAADKLATLADTKRVDAEKKAGKAETRARKATSLARQQTAIAKQQEGIARQQRSIGSAVRKSANAEFLFNRNDQSLVKSLLVAIESMRDYPTSEGKQTLKKIMALVPRSKEPIQHEAPVRAVCFSPDGELLATSSGTDTGSSLIRLFNTSNNHPIDLPAQITHPAKVTALVFSGNNLIIAGADGTAQIWEMGDYRRLASIPHGEGIIAIAISPNGEHLATISKSSVKVWGNWRTSAPAEVATVKQNRVAGAIFDPAGPQLIVLTSERFNQAPSWESCSIDLFLRVVFIPQTVIETIAVSPDGDYLATGDTDGAVRVWSRWQTEPRPAGGVIKHPEGITAIAFSPDGKYLLSASEDGTARVWEGWREASRLEVARLPHVSNVHAIAYDPRGRFIATGEDSRLARIWLTPKKIDFILSDEAEPALTIARSFDGKYLATTSIGSNGASVNVWKDWTTGSATKHKSKPIISPAKAIAFSPRGNLIAMLGDDGKIRLWNGIDDVNDSDFSEVPTSNQVGSFAFSPDGEFLATTSNDATVRIWTDLQNPVVTLKSVVRSASRFKFLDGIAFSPDGNYLVYGCMDRVEVRADWKSTSARLVTVLAHKGVQALAFSHDGSLLATADPFATAKIWQRWSTQQSAVMTTLTQTGGFKAIEFSPDADRIASVTDDGERFLRIWDLTRRPEAVELSAVRDVNAATFSADGNYLISAYRLSPIRIEPASLLTEACSRIAPDMAIRRSNRTNGDMSEEEWVKHYREKLCPDK